MLSLHPHACNLEDADGTIAALVSPRYGNGPFHVVAPAALFSTLNPSELVYLGGGFIRLSSGILDVRAAVRWSPRLPYPSPGPLDSHLLHQPTLWLHENAASALVSHPEQKTTMLNQRPEIAFRALEAGWRTGDLDLVADGARHLAGLGPGLTPAGDDFLVGWLAGIYFCGERCGLDTKIRHVAHAVVAAVTPRTTRLSAAWLRHAGSGEFAEPWHELAAGFDSGDSGAIEQAAARILATGATSGQAALFGFLNALRLFEAAC